MQEILREFMASSPTVKQYGVVIGFNYDDSQLAEHRHPTRHELDAVSTDMPIIVMHQSGHLGVSTARRWRLAGITAASREPRRRHDPSRGGRQDTQRRARGERVYRRAAQDAAEFTPEQMIAMLEAGQDIYLQNGFTTAQDGRTDPGNCPCCRSRPRRATLKIDVVAYPDLAAEREETRC